MTITTEQAIAALREAASGAKSDVWYYSPHVNALLAHIAAQSAWIAEQQAVIDQRNGECDRLINELAALREMYHAQEDSLFSLAQRIKGPSFDKYSHPAQQAIDVLAVAIFGENQDAGACRAGVLRLNSGSE